MGIKIITPPASEQMVTRHPNFSGIYVIRCMANGRVYVGSAVWIAKRWRFHREHLRDQRHHSIVLQRAWNKYGEEAFVFEVLAACEKDDLIAVEQKYIDEFRAADKRYGFNINPTAGSNLGTKFSPEACARISAGAKKRPPVSAESRARAAVRMRGNKYLLGHRHSAETLAKLSVSSKANYKPFGREWNALARAEISQRFAGKALSEEHKRKIAAALQGKIKSAAHRRRLGEASRYFDATEAHSLRRLAASGLSYRRLGVVFGCSAQTAWNVVNRAEYV